MSVVSRVRGPVSLRGRLRLTLVDDNGRVLPTFAKVNPLLLGVHEEDTK